MFHKLCIHAQIFSEWMTYMYLGIVSVSISGLTRPKNLIQKVGYDALRRSMSSVMSPFLKNFTVSRSSREPPSGKFSFTALG